MFLSGVGPRLAKSDNNDSSVPGLHIDHNGNFKRALKMIHKSKEIGVDIIKFQTFIPKSVVTRNASKAKYQNSNKWPN